MKDDNVKQTSPLVSSNFRMYHMHKALVAYGILNLQFEQWLQSTATHAFPLCLCFIKASWWVGVGRRGQTHRRWGGERRAGARDLDD